jgi:hypothetical protein
LIARWLRALRLNHPEIEWRLHANVQIDGQARIVDLCDWRDELYWFAQVARLSNVLAAPAYTAHAGRRGQASLTDVLRYTLEAEQLFGIPVGIEGHYPTKHDIWLLSTWAGVSAITRIRGALRFGFIPFAYCGDGFGLCGMEFTA